MYQRTSKEKENAIPSEIGTFTPGVKVSQQQFRNNFRPLVKTKVQVFFLIPSPCASKNRSSTSRHVNQETRSNRHENVMRSYFVLDLNRLWYFLRVRTLVQAILSFYRTMVFECKSRRRRRTNPHQNTLRMYRWEWKTLPKR